MKTHYAVTFTAKEQAALLPYSLPDSEPGIGEIAGSTLASLISAGTELNYAYMGDKFPTRSGYASVFRVEKVGEGVEGVEVGDVALALGHHTSYQVHAAQSTWRVPKGLDAGDATFARLMGVTMSTLTTTTARPPQRVVIAGLGPVGHLGAQIFQSCGYTVLALDPDEGRRNLALRAGILNVQASAPVGDTVWTGKTDLFIDCSGHEAAALDGCRLIKKRGEVVLLGTPWRKRTDISAHELLHAIFFRYAVVRSGWEWEVAKEPQEFRNGSIAANVEAALNWLSEGRVRVSGNYAVRRPQDCQEAYQDLLHAKEQSLAIVFDWTKLEV